VKLLRRRGDSLRRKPTVDQIIEKMNTMFWYHKIELAPGVVTPGFDWEHLWEPTLAYHRRTEFRGKRVLEIGCWDAYWSFETEKLGATDVWATDDVTQRDKGIETVSTGRGTRVIAPTVPFAIECLNSRIHYRGDVSVYDVDEVFKDPFDVIIFYGVLYHLRYPMLGLAKLRQVLRTGGLLLVETAALVDKEEPVMLWGRRNTYPDDVTTWNVPSLSCLAFLLESSLFEIDLSETIVRPDPGSAIGRAYVRAVAIPPEECGPVVIPDPFLPGPARNP
jgi:tRNA (mo5U34)-methyltransferase